jgi:hypothetical protein
MLSSEPLLHQDCCLSLSSGILEKILTSLGEANAKVLSIGSGSGLLEALLMRKCPQMEIQGVEVQASVNKYLDELNFYAVRGSWDVCSIAQDAKVWLFVYPRNPDLIKAYIEKYRSSQVLKAILWIGPTVDWETFQVCFVAAWLEIEDPIPLGPYETMVRIKVKE